jgi:transcription elongation factor Elf1
MNAIECPFCDSTATVDARLDTLDCDVCGIVVEIATDPIAADAARLAA